MRITRIFPYIFLFGLLISCNNNPSQETIFTIQEDELNRLKLQYYSDYFSFVGSDNHGIVAFAIDNNRGQDQDTWQADHFVVLYDETAGWQNVTGNGQYPNPKMQLEKIPNSKYFQFKGDPAKGILIDSPVNNLRLEIAAVSTVIHHAEGMSRYRLGSADATLTWKDRAIKGRVIHEYLYLPAFNRLSRKYTGAFHDFHGFYAVIDGQGDFYLHQQKGDFFSRLTGKRDGFIVHKGQAYQLREITGTTESSGFALGFYRWPRQWRGNFVAGSDRFEYRLRLEHQFNIANWFVGGFAMGIIKGNLKNQDQSHKVVGLAELIL